MEDVRCKPDSRPRRRACPRPDPNDSSGDLHVVGDDDASRHGDGSGPHPFGVDHRPARPRASGLGARTVIRHRSGRHRAGHSGHGSRHRFATAWLGRRRLAVGRWRGGRAAHSRRSDPAAAASHDAARDVDRRGAVRRGAPAREPHGAGILLRRRRDDPRHGDATRRGALSAAARGARGYTPANFVQTLPRRVYENLFRVRPATVDKSSSCFGSPPMACPLQPSAAFPDVRPCAHGGSRLRRAST